ncbi:hypothetical protein TeGR_g3854 [Tetraparma gracilis]|uniref:Uncharacterized protein n=1 Tax=Tetraparma gracilis TaxID=2962635 RepID=A0ABQ6N1C4_9STRA|nr:hypothetical protein TeGR_g3854 [Tetraparma gracilis]
MPPAPERRRGFRRERVTNGRLLLMLGAVVAADLLFLLFPFLLTDPSPVVHVKSISIVSVPSLVCAMPSGPLAGPSLLLLLLYKTGMVLASSSLAFATRDLPSPALSESRVIRRSTQLAAGLFCLYSTLAAHGLDGGLLAAFGAALVSFFVGKSVRAIMKGKRRE